MHECYGKERPNPGFSYLVQQGVRLLTFGSILDRVFKLAASIVA